MPESRLEYLFSCYIKNDYSAQEEEELMKLLNEPENELAFQKLIENVIDNTGSELEMNYLNAAVILQNIFNKGNGLVVPLKKEHTPVVLWRAAAVAILFMSITISYFIWNKNQVIKEKVSQVHATDILPGRNRAVLSTSDGSAIVLDSIQNGTTINKGNTQIGKQSGLLIYHAASAGNTGMHIIYNTLTTPRGGQYQVILSDGSKVWLNAASSLHFPSSFSGDQRTVELTGEAYFEVAKNKEKPFLVKVGDMQIKVLGTHFNVNAYSDENATKTSLLEGSVKITKGNVTGILKPGEQAILDNKKDRVEIVNANMSGVIAWKNGLFQFDGADITTIMREIGRWYNVEVVYDEKGIKIPLRRFEGEISRNAQLSEVLQILKLSKVECTVVDNKIIVH